MLYRCADRRLDNLTGQFDKRQRAVGIRHRGSRCPDGMFVYLNSNVRVAEVGVDRCVVQVRPSMYRIDDLQIAALGRQRETRRVKSGRVRIPITVRLSWCTVGWS